MSFENLEEPRGNFGKFYNQGQTSVVNWLQNLKKLKRFILGHNRRPTLLSENLYEKQLARWEHTQLKNSKQGLRRGLMMHDEVFRAWVEFLAS